MIVDLEKRPVTGRNFTKKDIENFPEHSADICDDLEWFVDVAGLQNIILQFLRIGDSLTIVEGRNADSYTKIDDNNHVHTKPKGSALLYAPIGLYYDGSHWVYKKNDKEIIDSYPSGMNHQKAGTAHFCQTFAIMYYLRVDNELKDGEYAENIKCAIAFWSYVFKNYPKIKSMFLKDIKEYWGKGIGTYLKIQKYCVPLKKPLAKFTYIDLQKFLEWMFNNANRFINCKQG